MFLRLRDWVPVAPCGLPGFCLECWLNYTAFGTPPPSRTFFMLALFDAVAEEDNTGPCATFFPITANNPAAYCLTV
jgi:hypothetical protein